MLNGFLGQSMVIFFLFLLYYYMYKYLYCVRGDASIASCFLVNKYMIYSDILRGGKGSGNMHIQVYLLLEHKFYFSVVSKPAKKQLSRFE